jgi:hypothetical protein
MFFEIKTSEEKPGAGCVSVSNRLPQSKTTIWSATVFKNAVKIVKRGAARRCSSCSDRGKVAVIAVDCVVFVVDRAALFVVVNVIFLITHRLQHFLSKVCASCEFQSCHPLLEYDIFRIRIPDSSLGCLYVPNQTDRQTDRHTDRQTNRQTTHKQTGKQTSNRETIKRAPKQTIDRADKQKNARTNKRTRQTDTERQNDRQTYKRTDGPTD